MEQFFVEESECVPQLPRMHQGLRDEQSFNNEHI